ncbi:hypothetical protein [Cohnella silvisoli]|uniref:Flagellar hook-length control protein FliK n=1 Tax=Cohnella silvisoli TaxID=2873699 RepID=A0ABV1KWS4_9BACL|nr:hypothetical protein [Cohnella silvisoli]MCD9023339.1 hypothetical protein [Cohnella silvisoli]
MSMNIGPMLRALMGEAQPADSRALELRIGQIVRGVLVELLENQEAMININGVQVRAKLDAEMPVGKSTLLQVQPGGVGGLVTLKPLMDTSDVLPEEGLKDVLKTFGLPEQKWAMELLRGLKRDGYPIGRETAAFFNTAAALKPAGVDAASWSSASDVAFRRGLTPTETTLSSLRQALFGQPIHEELAGLRTAVANWLGGAAAPSSEAAALGQRLQSLLTQGTALLAEGEAQLAGDAANASGANLPKVTDEGKAQLAANLVNSAKETANGSKAAGEPTRMGSEAVVARGEGEAGRAMGGPAAAPTPAANANAAAQSATARAATEQGARAQPGAAQALAAAGEAAAGQAPAAPAAADSLRAGNKADAAAQASAPKPEAAWIGRFLQWLGVGHEHRLMHPAEGLPAGAAAALAPGADAPGQEARPAADTLKGALLALAAHDDVPPALREAAQTLANQVTGQQLLLSSDRSAVAPFSHMTLFVPMKGANGETTATVHVQTRRSRRGEWDVDNCHLLFDLRMRNLGDTIVDVQVVDRIVSLKLLNDFPGMSDLLDQAREELASGMSAAGFQLFSLTAAPLPQWKSGSINNALPTSGADKAAIASAYAAKPYKGVDYRA